MRLKSTLLNSAKTVAIPCVLTGNYASFNEIEVMISSWYKVMVNTRDLIDNDGNAFTEKQIKDALAYAKRGRRVSEHSWMD